MTAASEIYSRERQGLEVTFTGKTNLIAAQYQSFWNDSTTAKADVDAYLNSVRDHVYPTGLAKWVSASTPFTVWKGPVLAESDEALLIGNRASFDVAQYMYKEAGPQKAGMSMVHLLCIPKRPIFNSVSLDASSVSILEHMIDLFKDSWTKQEVRDAVLEHQKLSIGAQNHAHPDNAAYLVAFEHWEELQGMINDLSVDDFHFGVHMWPDHSVGHLHLHIVAAPYECRKYSTSCHDKKTKDAFEVIDFIKHHS